ncbi:MAG: hypothetical protein C0467_13665 [Planctomycetaceae bacterium]|nr:hypothetical protein [Planctomycetaceae bacterium]
MSGHQPCEGTVRLVREDRVPRWPSRDDRLVRTSSPRRSSITVGVSRTITSPGNSRPHATLLYHYFHPDDVVSARLFSDLAEGLVACGWDVTVVPCNRGCRDESVSLPLKENWNGIRIERAWRPRFVQASTIGRLANTAWMLASWAKASITIPRRRQDVMIVGTDPVFGVLAAIPWRALRRRTRIVHWCHDLHPEAAIADGMTRESSLATRVVKRFVQAAYRRCDVLAVYCAPKTGRGVELG